MTAMKKLPRRPTARPRPAFVFDLAPLVVVTQTLVELMIMVVFVRLIPRLLPTRAGEPAGREMPLNSRP